MIDDIQSMVDLSLKRDRILYQLEKFDYDFEKTLDFFLTNFHKKKETKKELPKKVEVVKIQPKQNIKQKQKKKQIDELQILRKASRKLSKDEIKELPLKKENWNKTYQIEKMKVDLQKEKLPQTINIGIFGHVDSGKSTLLGHLFYKLNIIDKREMHKFEKMSNEIGKGSFKYAWLMDEMEEERRKGVTIDTNEKTIEIKNKRLHFIDTPGHTDYIFNTLKGATQVDVAIFLLDAFSFFHDMEKEIPQTHINLMQSMSVKQMIICINKMDQVKWEEKRYLEILTTIAAYFKTKKLFLDTKILYIPISGFSGENLEFKVKTDWYKGECLLGELIKIEKTYNQSEFTKPLRLNVKNVFKGNNNKKKGLGLTVKIEGGILDCNDKLLVMPLDKIIQINAIFREETKIPFGICGDTVDIILKNFKEEEFEEIKKGYVLCCPSNPIPFVKRFKARISTLEMNHPIIKGSRYNIHIGIQSGSGVFRRLNFELDENEKPYKKNPRLIGSKKNAIIEFIVDERLCMENFINFEYYSKIQISDEFKTIAYGKILELIN